jgi:hypothetical protein
MTAAQTRIPPVAVAACYVSSKTQWDHFARNWDEVREREGFDVFHMCEFMAKPEAGHKPYCDWENAKKDRVYQKLASIINTRIGMVLRLLCRKLRLIDTFSRNLNGCAADHYTWAIRSLLNFVSDWRQNNEIFDPMQYVFHRGSLSQTRIDQIWKSESKKKQPTGGVSFWHRA